MIFKTNYRSPVGHPSPGGLVGRAASYRHPQTMSCLNIDRYLPAIDRALLISWLLKDFGWMTTNIYLGFPFGVVSVLLHAFLLAFDPRRSFRFYNISLLIWVVGNFIWMTIEFVSVNSSSNVHMGAHVPLGGVSTAVVNDLINVKTFLFLAATVIQVAMYIGIYCKFIPMPEGEDEDQVSKNEVMLLFYGNKSFDRAHSDEAEFGDDVSLNTDSDERSSSRLTLAYIENMYIVFWISKDLFWSWGTGDLINGFRLAIFYEATAMSFGTLSLLVHLVSAYVYRRNTLQLLDCITTVLWISANFVWMCGEFFIRYDNLTYDDEDPGNDAGTRIVSLVLFLLGLLIQVYILACFAANKRLGVWKNRTAQVEMTTFKLPMRYNILINFTPQSERANGAADEEDEESTVMF